MTRRRFALVISRGLYTAARMRSRADLAICFTRGNNSCPIMRVALPTPSTLLQSCAINSWPWTTPRRPGTKPKQRPYLVKDEKMCILIRWPENGSRLRRIQTVDKHCVYHFFNKIARAGAEPCHCAIRGWCWSLGLSDAPLVTIYQAQILECAGQGNKR